MILLILPLSEEQDPLTVQPDALTLEDPAAPATAHPPHSSSYYTYDDHANNASSDDADEERDEDADNTGMSAPFAVPFQSSTAMPVQQQGQASGAHSGPLAPPARKTHRGHPRFLRLIIIAALVLAAVGFLWITVFAQPVRPMVLSMKASPHMTASRPTASPHPAMPTAVQGAPMPISVPQPASTAGPEATGSPQGTNWVPQQLPAAWTAAGLSGGDAIFALRTAWSFTDREEGLDFRNVGTRAQQGGTFTASAFILSPGGQTRFFHHDVREINNTLFDHVHNVQLMQAAVNAVPRLVQFQTQGQQQFAWVDVAYQLYQSQIDPASGQRTEGLVMDPATAQPRTYQMSVLLLRVTPGTQGANAPMGERAGW